MSEKPVNVKGRKFQFHMVDVGKYYDRVKYGVFNWPVRFTSVARANKPAPMNPQRELVNELHFDALFQVLKKTDWSKTSVYEMFCKYGHWKHSDDSIYSEMELRYLKTSLRHMTNDISHKEFNNEEGRDIITKHWQKAMDTLEKLMSQMNMMYFYEKLRLKLPE